MFDIASDVIKEMAARMVAMRKRGLCKCVDDLMPIGLTHEVAEYRQAYHYVAERAGVRLAENELECAADKAFGVGDRGVLLGEPVRTFSYLSCILFLISQAFILTPKPGSILFLRTKPRSYYTN